MILDIRPPARPGVPPSWCAGGDYHTIGSVTEQVKQAMKGMSSEFKSQLKSAMRARQMVRFDSWAKYLAFVTTVQQTVQLDDSSSAGG